MAQQVNVSNVQKLEFDVTTAEGPSHVTVVTGLMTVPGAIMMQASSGQQKESFETLLDPTLAPGQFRRAAATASITNWTYQSNNGPEPTQASWSIDQVEATLHDESGKIQLRVDATLAAGGSGTSLGIVGIAFQVTTLSKL